LRHRGDERAVAVRDPGIHRVGVEQAVTEVGDEDEVVAVEAGEAVGRGARQAQAPRLEDRPAGLLIDESRLDELTGAETRDVDIRRQRG